VLARFPTAYVPFLGILLLSGCSGDRPELRGATCEVNSDCDSRLVCRLSRCRRECADHRDCGLGLQCLLNADKLGACQLEDELECRLDSECADVLVCRGGACVNECAVDLDCPPLATCSQSTGSTPPPPCDASSDTPCECHVPEAEAQACVYNSDCEAPLICDDDQLCRPECRADRDCIAPRVCAGMLCVLPDGGP